MSLLYRPKHLRRLLNNAAPIKDVQNLAEDDSFDDEVKTMNVYVPFFQLKPQKWKISIENADVKFALLIRI